MRTKEFLFNEFSFLFCDESEKTFGRLSKKLSIKLEFNSYEIILDYEHVRFLSLPGCKLTYHYCRPFVKEAEKTGR